MGFRPAIVLNFSNTTKLIKLCGKSLIQQPKKPLYSAIGPSFLRSKPSAWNAFEYCFVASFISRTLMVSTERKREEGLR